MSEIDVLLIELQRLLTELKDSRRSEELKAHIIRLFSRVNLIIEQTDDVEEMERIFKDAAKVAGMASYLMDKEPEVREFLQLLGIPVEEVKN